MRRALAASLLLVACAACGDNESSDVEPDGQVADATATTDAATDATPDAAADAATDAGIDGPDVDAAIDAGIDGPELDAAIDAAETPVDAPTADAPDVDAPPPDAPLLDLGGTLIALRFESPTISPVVRISLDTGATQDLTPTNSSFTNDVMETPDRSRLVISGRLGPGLPFGIFAIRTDGTGAPVMLSMPGLNAFNPRLSPSGDRVAFAEYLNANSTQLVTTRLDGTDRAVVSGTRQVGTWAWRPTTDRLWFSSSPGVGTLLETCADHACLRVIEPGNNLSSFSFSPDGAHAVWTRLVGNGPTEVLTHMDLTTEQTAVVTSGHSYGTFTWSPDARHLAFSEYDFGSFMTSRVMRADGTGLATLPRVVPGYGDINEWSPDSQHLLAFLQHGQSPNASFHLFTYCADASCRHELESPQDGLIVFETWSPDSRVVHRVTTGLVADCAPSSPCPRATVSGTYGVYDEPVWATGQTRYAFSGPDGLFVADAIGQPPAQTSPIPMRPVGFDAAGTRVLAVGAGAHLHALRVDGTEDRDLGALNVDCFFVYP